MPEEPGAEREAERTAFSRQIELKAARKLRVQRTPMRSVWLGFGVTGVIGWSVATPALLGALLGLWLDSRYPSGRSWTLALLVAGLCLGCFQAWNWVAKEDKAMHEDKETDKDKGTQEEEKGDD